MNFPEILEQIESELEQISQQEAANQQEQAELAQNIKQLNQSIEQLQQEIEQKYKRQSELDQQALDLCKRSEDLTEKKDKIAKIESFTAEFQGLKAEFQDNQDLLATLYSSISDITGVSEQPSKSPKPQGKQGNNSAQAKAKGKNFQAKAKGQNPVVDHQQDSTEKAMTMTIPAIKQKLTTAEKLYQKLVAKHLDQYHTYQNQILDGLDLIWCSVGFVVFGKESYKQMCLRYHPDRAGSEKAMQLVNTAWEIAQEHVKTGD